MNNQIYTSIIRGFDSWMPVRDCIKLSGRKPSIVLHV